MEALRTKPRDFSFGESYLANQFKNRANSKRNGLPKEGAREMNS